MANLIDLKGFAYHWDLLPSLSSFVINHFCYQTSESLPSLCLARYYNLLIGKRVNNSAKVESVANGPLRVVDVYVTYTKCPPLDITFFFFLVTKIFLMATILQLKVTKRRLFEKVSLESCHQYANHQKPLVKYMNVQKTLFEPKLNMQPTFVAMKFIKVILRQNLYTSLLFLKVAIDC